MGETVELTAADGHTLAAYTAGPGDAPRALILCHDTSGLCGHMRRMADRAAAFGFRVVAPAFFDRIERGIDLHTHPDDLDRGAAIAARVTVAMQMNDSKAAMAHLACDRTGLLGFGWGATTAWRAAARLPDLHAAVGFYGTGIAEARQETPLCPRATAFRRRRPPDPAQRRQRHFQRPAASGNCHIPDRRSPVRVR